MESAASTPGHAVCYTTSTSIVYPDLGLNDDKIPLSTKRAESSVGPEHLTVLENITKNAPTRPTFLSSALHLARPSSTDARKQQHPTAAQIQAPLTLESRV